MNKYKIFYSIILLNTFVLLCSVGVRAEVSDPCPDSIEALNTTPDDLSKVQADIDRFTLCVERAQLLKRLNDLALENQDDLQNLPAVDPVFQIVPITFDPSLQPEETHTAEEQQQIADWEILSIFGSGLDLSAKIMNQNGLFAQIKTGDELPDGHKVVGITKTSVTLAQDKEHNIIEWLGGVSDGS